MKKLFLTLFLIGITQAEGLVSFGRLNPFKHSESKKAQAALMLQAAQKDTLVTFTEGLNRILEEVDRIDIELDKMLFWSKFRVFDRLKKFYLTRKMPILQSDVDLLGDSISTLPDTLEDGGPNSYKHELYNHYRTMQERIDAFIRQARNNASTKQLQGMTYAFADDFETNVKLCNKVIEEESKLKGKLRFITWECRLKRLGIPFLVRRCVKDKASRMALVRTRGLKDALIQLPQGPVRRALAARIQKVEDEFIQGLK